MRPARRTDRHNAAHGPGGTHLTLIDAAGAAPRAHAAQARSVPPRELAQIVHLPVAPTVVREPAAPRVVAEASLQVKRFHGGVADDDRYTATLHAASDAPAALLAALADAATRIEDLVRAGAPDDRLIMTISIRR